MHVHVNAAASLDGKLSSRRREQVTISGDDDFARVDEIRATADAVAVGVGTVLADDPHLTLDDPGELIFSLFEAGLVDELTLYVGSLVIGGRDAPTLADGDGFVSDFPRLSLRDVERVDDGVLLTYDC